MYRKRRVHRKREVNLFKSVLKKRLYLNKTHQASFSAAHVIAKLKGYVRTEQVTPQQKRNIISILNQLIPSSRLLYGIKFEDFHLPAYFWDNEKGIVKPVTTTSSTSPPPSDGDTLCVSDMEIETSHIANEAEPIAQSDKEKITRFDYDEAFFDHLGNIVERMLDSSNLPHLTQDKWNLWSEFRIAVPFMIFCFINVPTSLVDRWIREAEETEPTTYEIFCNRFEQRQPPK